MTYESPITLITRNSIKEINDKTDEVILKAVVNVLPEVNKEELIKALSYDRGQYSKGYKDRDDEIVRCKDCGVIDDHGFCHIVEDYPDIDNFCSWAERREP